MKSISFELPWPPSVNTYWRRNGNRYFISPQGVQYKKTVYGLCNKFKGTFKPTDKLQVLIEAYPPDKRKRDIDNILKSVFDCLGDKGCGVYEDDVQIDKLTVWRLYPMEGKLLVTIAAMDTEAGV